MKLLLTNKFIKRLFICLELRKLGAYQNIDGLEPASKMLNIAQSKRLYQNTYNQLFTTMTGLDSGMYV